jgi:N6-adenosine-specific RNA methylase IME4
MIWEGLNPPYATVVADPPWPQQGGGPQTGRAGFGDAKGASKPMPFSTLSVADIADLPVGDLAGPDAHLYLWTTNGFLEQAFAVARAWGFQYSTTLVWAKTPMGGGLGGKQFGITTEFILFCRRGSLAPRGRHHSTWFQWKRAYDHRGKPQHSAKPPSMLDAVEAVSPGPYAELFARAQRLGWDSWGHGYEIGASA